MPLTLENFGRNVRFEATDVVLPRTHEDVAACLDRYRGRRMRACGRLHSWSPVCVCPEVVVDLRHLTNLAIEIADDGRAYVEIGAGCTIDEVLDYLNAHGRYTLPTYSIIGRQTLAGAAATGTHGAGRESLSHFVAAVSVAAYDKATGKARIYRWTGGDELRAARCGLGCAGIMLSVRMPVEPDYLIEERTSWFARLEDVLAQESAFPLQQFYLIPWSWRWFAQHRRRLEPESGVVPGLSARFHRILRSVGVDIVLNGTIRLLSRTFQSPRALRALYRYLFPLIARPGMRVIDRSRHLLTMRHDRYRYVEMELFVPERHVARAAAFVEWVLRRCGGERPAIPAVLAGDEFGRTGLEGVDALQGTYMHDHALTFRRVLRDDTLISMTSGPGAEAWYAISLITYQRDLEPFLQATRVLAESMASAYGARPHWGKICPLNAAAIARLYPALSRFREVCARVDPERVFVNEFAHRTLGL